MLSNSYSKSIRPQFKIGDWVWITAKLHLEYDKNDNRQIIRTPIVIRGQICGAKRKMLGKYKGEKIEYDSCHHENEIGYNPPYLNVTGSIIVWLVRTGYLNKPYEVLYQDIRIPLTKLDEKLPWLHKIKKTKNLLTKREKEKNNGR